MPLELEAKIKVPDLDPLRQKLRELGAQRIGAFHETNTFFDSPNAALQNSGKGLRIRINRNVGNATEEAIITYKGPRQAGTFKSRQELETTISNAEQTEAIFTALGFERQLSFEKRRESWKLDDCKIELDEVPHLGTFLEIEGPDEQTITVVQHQLGLDHAPHISDSYASLLAQWLKQNGRADSNIKFSN
jgi:predicted adenylyl cyclase CyaB